MNQSSRLKNILNERTDLWDDETDSEASSSDQTEVSVNSSNVSSDENSQPSPRRTCCLICSILPNLSDVNTCRKHLTSLTATVPPPQVIYMMPPPIANRSTSHCHCRSKSKRHCRSSSSSSSDQSRRHQRKRIRTILSSDSSSDSSQNDAFFSPSAPSQMITTNQQHRPDYSQGQLSPSLPPSTNIDSRTNTNIKNHQELVFTSFLQRKRQENNEEIESMLKDTQSKANSNVNSSNIVETSFDSHICSATISNRPIIHVKDDDEEYDSTTEKLIPMNMTQLTEEMINREYPQPKIYLERIYLDDSISIYDSS
ncbi:unnamed protein product [Adineta ricciae]|uniref:Uncharacterized protein n=1 Tax=Adineta ricciae TaxID=249248 RepID=A0A814F366_ADIRI|nr:unnamed protein product [Adineta ricciae]